MLQDRASCGRCLGAEYAEWKREARRVIVFTSQHWKSTESTHRLQTVTALLSDILNKNERIVFLCRVL